MLTMTTTSLKASTSGLLGNRLTRHGTPVILSASGLLLVTGLLLGYGLEDSPIRSALLALPLILWLFVLSFFRNPQRPAPAGDLPICPADGKIIVVEDVDDEVYVEEPAVRIQIFLSVFNVHVNRSPVNGVVEHLRHVDGSFKSATQASAREVNERQEIGIRSHDGLKILVRQIAGLIARRIVCPLQAGDSIDRGFDFGMIRFGSQTEIVIPPKDGKKFTAAVKAGQKVQGGRTILGEWK